MRDGDEPSCTSRRKTHRRTRVGRRTGDRIGTYDSLVHIDHALLNADMCVIVMFRDDNQLVEKVVAFADAGSCHLGFIGPDTIVFNNRQCDELLGELDRLPRGGELDHAISTMLSITLRASGPFPSGDYVRFSERAE
jgi:hypothetical protein